MASVDRGTRPIQALLVPVDLAWDAERALRPALRIARRAGVPVILFAWGGDEADALPAKTYLSALAAALPDVSVEVVVSDVGPAAEIVAAAVRTGATVCMATHGRSGAGRALLGSVGEEVRLRPWRAAVPSSSPWRRTAAPASPARFSAASP
jgi:nucleotide-binding universal stress UspA family protein